MQSFLTRAGRARICRCNTCAGVAKTIIRRSTTGAEVKVSYRHAFTTLYTSIFATAAFVDAKFKDDRRKDLENQISEAKDAVARLQLQNAAAEVEVQPSIIERVANEGRDYGDSPILERADVRPSLIAPSNEPKTPTTRIFEQHGGEHWDVFHESNFRQSLRGLKRSDYRVLEQWLKASVEDGEVVVSGTKPEEWTFNVTQLVDYLLLEHDRRASQKALPPARTPLREAIDRLKAVGYPEFRWPSHDPTAFSVSRTRLSKRMARDIAADKDALGTIERICYNLLTSQYPLTIHTYNTLIVHLNKAGHHKIAQCILQSHFAHFSQHHAQSQAVVLNHDREFGNYAAIHRNVSVILQNSSVYFSRGGNYLLDSMVRAYAGFCNMTDAILVFCHGLSVGLTIGPQALFQLIGLCIWRLDRAHAAELIRAFTDYPEQFEYMLTAEPTAQSILLHQMSYLLDVTGLWRHPSKLGPELKTYGLDPEKFRRFRMTIRICNIQRQFNHTARMTRRLEQILSTLETPKYKRMRRADAVRLVMGKAAQAAEDFDFHMEAAMPASWVDKDFKALKPIHAPRQRRRVWTEEDHETARASLRLAVLSKEVEDGGRRVADCSLELLEMNSEGGLEQRLQGEALYVPEAGRGQVAEAMG